MAYNRVLSRTIPTGGIGRTAWSNDPITCGPRVRAFQVVTESRCWSGDVPASVLPGASIALTSVGADPGPISCTVGIPIPG